jgi:hypothetical protein
MWFCYALSSSSLVAWSFPESCHSQIAFHFLACRAITKLPDLPIQTTPAGSYRLRSAACVRATIQSRVPPCGSQLPAPSLAVQSRGNYAFSQASQLTRGSPDQRPHLLPLGDRTARIASVSRLPTRLAPMHPAATVLIAGARNGLPVRIGCAPNHGEKSAIDPLPSNQRKLATGLLICSGLSGRGTATNPVVTRQV